MRPTSRAVSRPTTRCGPLGDRDGRSRGSSLPLRVEGALDERGRRHLAVVRDRGRQQRAVHRRQRRVPEAGRGARELQRVGGHVQVRWLDGDVEGDGLLEAEGVPDARQLRGGQVAARELGEDRVLRLAEAVGQRLAAPVDDRQVDEVVGENRRDAAVVADPGGAGDAALGDQRGGRDDLEHRRGRRPGAAAPARAGPGAARRPSGRPSPARGRRGSRRTTAPRVGDLEPAQHVLDRLLQARVERQHHAPAVLARDARSRRPRAAGSRAADPGRVHSSTGSASAGERAERSGDDSDAQPTQRRAPTDAEKMTVMVSRSYM